MGAAEARGDSRSNQCAHTGTCGDRQRELAGAVETLAADSQGSSI